MESVAYIALAVLACLGLGLAVRRWWIVLVGFAPSLLWLLPSLPIWSEEDSDGVTGSEFFWVGLIYIGLPIPVLMAIGVLIGQALFPPKPKPKPKPTP